MSFGMECGKWVNIPIDIVGELGIHVCNNYSCCCLLLVSMIRPKSRDVQPAHQTKTCQLIMWLIIIIDYVKFKSGGHIDTHPQVEPPPRWTKWASHIGRTLSSNHDCTLLEPMVSKPQNFMIRANHNRHNYCRLQKGMTNYKIVLTS